VLHTNKVLPINGPPKKPAKPDAKADKFPEAMVAEIKATGKTAEQVNCSRAEILLYNKQETR
jgi:hypothetical protein